MALQSKVKAVIKRSSKKARENANYVDRHTLDELTKAYKQASTDITHRIISYESGNGQVRLSALKELKQSVLYVIDQLRNYEERLLEIKQMETARHAALVFSEILRDEHLSTIISDSVRTARQFIAVDGLQLSDRLWRINNHAKEIVGRAIESAIIQGHSASRLADEFERKGLSIPREIKHNFANAQASNIAKVTTKELMKESSSPYQNALRLFRTEINRAHGLAYQKTAFETNEVIGTRFLLSPNHTETDICDMHAKVNLYGLGAGVYPKGKSPWPAHPNTLSYEEVVFSDEVTDKDRQSKQDRITFLSNLSPAHQQQVLGIKKQQALSKGHLKESEINTPWHVLKTKYQRKGIEL